MLTPNAQNTRQQPEATPEQLQFFNDNWIPNYAYARRTNATGTYKYTRSNALECDYIEVNKTGRLQSLIVVDYDGLDFAEWRHETAGFLPPSWVTLNPHTNTGHIVYALAKPVPLTDASRRPPVLYLAKIESGITTALEGDDRFNGRLMRNPLRHPTVWGNQTYYLKTLAEALRECGHFPKGIHQRKVITTSAIGRNVALFDLTRAWSYSAVRSFYKAPFSEWNSAVFEYARAQNLNVIANDFTRGAMSDMEVKHLARSVAGWTWQKFDQASWIKRQTALSHKAAEVRRANAAEWQAIARSKADTHSPEQIAAEVGKSVLTVARFIKDQTGGQFAQIEQRRQRVAAAAANGFTVKQIAATEQVSAKTIARDLEAIRGS